MTILSHMAPDKNRYVQKFDLQNFEALQIKSQLKNSFANNDLMGYMESPEL